MPAGKVKGASAASGGKTHKKAGGENRAKKAAGTKVKSAAPGGLVFRVGDDLLNFAKTGIARPREGVETEPRRVAKGKQRKAGAGTRAGRAGVAKGAEASPVGQALLTELEDAHQGAAAPAAALGSQRSREEQTRDIIMRAVAGGSADALDPLATSGLAISSAPFIGEYAAARATECATEGELLASAHQYFSQLNRVEKQRNKEAMRKIKQMKAVNKKGGDKDGFQFVLPTNTKRFVQELVARDANGGAVVDSEELESHFRGDGERDEKPMRRKKPRKHFQDDFYAFQVAKKWTKNAESFLSRGRAHRDMFASRSKLRNPNKL